MDTRIRSMDSGRMDPAIVSANMVTEPRDILSSRNTRTSLNTRMTASPGTSASPATARERISST